MTPSLSLFAPVLAGLTSTLVIAAMLRVRHALPMDTPNHRSLHDTPIPRTGGLGIVAGVMVAWALIWWDQGRAAQVGLLLPALVLSGFSLIDDVRGLPVTWRFAAQILLATLLLFHLQLPVAWPMQVLLVLAVGWMTNLYNFMDGSNGLAGGMALFGFGFYALAAALAGHLPLALVCASIALAALAFLRFNFHPAQIFMGDGGSIPLGFLAAALGLAGWQLGAWPGYVPPLIFAPFVLDASITLGRRAARGEKVWQAHREHYYQRLIRMGWSHRRTALAEYGLMLACGIVALVMQQTEPATATGALLGLLIALGLIMARIDTAWRRFQAKQA